MSLQTPPPEPNAVLASIRTRRDMAPRVRRVAEEKKNGEKTGPRRVHTRRRSQSSPIMPERSLFSQLSSLIGMSELDKASKMAKKRPKKQFMNTVNLFTDITDAFATMEPREIVRKLGAPLNEVSDFLKVNRLVYHDMEILNSRFHDFFDGSVRRAASAIAARADDESAPVCMKTFLSTNREIPDSYWKYVIDNDNCYFFEFRNRKRSPEENKIYQFKRSIAHIVSGQESPDPVIVLFIAVNEAKDAHSTVDDFLRKLILYVSRGEDISLDVYEMVAGILGDLELRYASLTKIMEINDRPSAEADAAQKDGDGTGPAFNSYLGHLSGMIHIFGHFVFRLAVFREAFQLNDAEGACTTALEKQVLARDGTWRRKSASFYEHYTTRLRHRESIQLTFGTRTTQTANDIRTQVGEEMKVREELRELTVSSLWFKETKDSRSDAAHPPCGD